MTIVFCFQRVLLLEPATEYVHDVVFPVSQPGNCSATCLLSSPAPRNGQDIDRTHTVTQWLCHSLSFYWMLVLCRVEHQPTLISYSHSNSLRDIYIQQSTGNKEPKSQRLSAGAGGSMVGKGVISILQERVSGARWAAGKAKSSVQQGRASGCLLYTSDAADDWLVV